MAIIGEKLESYVIDQINARQRLHGSGAGTANNNSPSLRSDQQINLLNSNTAWVKLASGISVDASRLRDIGVSTSYNGMGLAKNYILYAGFSRLEQDGTDRLIQRQGFLPQDPNSSYTYGTYGYSPMPGISSADIKALNRGSLKKATVKLTVHNKQQFNIIDLLYLRLGYTVLLEWGNSIYTPDGVTREIVRNTLLENTFFNINSKGSYLDMLGPIEQYRQKYAGNYDALLGKVSNFSWAFQPDGSYDIEITIISLGDVIESLKTNISAPQNLLKFIEDSTGDNENPDEPTSQSDIIEDNKDANAISSMLWVWKWVNRIGISSDTESSPIYIKLGDGTETFVGGFLNTSGEDITTDLVSYRFYYTAYEDGWIFDGAENPIRTSFPARYPQYESTVKEFPKPDTRKQAEEWRKKLEEDLGSKATFEESRTVYSREGIASTRYDTYKVKVRFKKVKNSERSVSTSSPIQNFDDTDAFWLNSEPVQYYLRFGALLNYIKNDILPKIDIDGTDKPSIFDIDEDTYSNFMYSLPNQISLDPRVCLVRNDHFTKSSGTAEVLSKLNPFRAEDYVQDNPNLNKAYPFNIYLNFEFIIESLNSNADERGDVNVYNFLKSVCDGLNKSLGGINNLEPIIDENSNTLKIIDTTPIPGFGQKEADYVLQLYGYKKDGSLYDSTFVRKVDLKTSITPEYATMVTVGATAEGYVKGVEATAFSKWNVGLTDRFKEKFIPGNPESQNREGEIDEAVINYTEKFLAPKKFTSCYGFSGNLMSSSPNLKISTDAIENNLSVVTEYYKYLISSQGIKSGGTIGFIPFKISFTMDGISGIKIYNKLHVDTRFLPKAYGDNLNLIVTGVNHKLANDDWETDIEATVMPKTEGGTDIIITSEAIKEDIQEAKNAPGSEGGNKAINCSSIPSSSSSVKRIVKAKDNTNAKAIQYVINYLEGGYFHPVHAWNSNGTFKPGYDYRKPKGSGTSPGNSGETLWGIDRPNGAHEKSSDLKIKNAGIKFWNEVDKLSGYGSYKSQNQTVKKYNWNIKKYPKKSNSWQHYYNPGFTPGTVLADNAQIIIEKGFEKNMVNYFGSHPLYKIVKSDGRLLFMYFRAWWNGPGWFQKFAKNLKKVYDSGTTNVDKLICADLTYRYNAYSPDFWRNGISKMKDMIDFNPN